MRRIHSHRMTCSVFAIALTLAASCGALAWGQPQGAAPASQDQQTTSAWSDRLYGQYDHESFMKFEPANQPITRERLDRPLLEAAIFYATNEQRVKQGRKPFKFDRALADAAAGHSEAMMRHHFFSHKNPADKSRRTMADRFKLHQIPPGAWGENIAKTPVNERGGETYLEFARKLLQQWMNSSGHRRNILRPAFNHLGCGVAPDGGDGGFFYIASTQAFSKNAASQ